MGRLLLAISLLAVSLLPVSFPAVSFRTVPTLAVPFQAAASGPDQSIAEAIAVIRSVGLEGQGNVEAAKAWKILVDQGMPALIPVLEGFRGARPPARNWLRSAVDAIVEREGRGGVRPPAAMLAGFFSDTSQHTEARRIAYELYEQLDRPAARTLIAGMIDDPGLDIRRDAISERLAAAGDDPARLQPLFAAARDRDQVELIAKKLGKSRADVVRHFNFITRWHVLGPFDAPGGGFQNQFPPEQTEPSGDLKAEYQGKNGEPIRWQVLTASENEEPQNRDYCTIDLVKTLGPHKNAVAYFLAIVETERELAAELRAASQNAVRLFVNGQLVYEREIYHQGTIMDQHACPIVLKPGRNTILCKVCQNDQKEPWAQAWLFQARICDSTGGPVPVKLISPPEAP